MRWISNQATGGRLALIRLEVEDKTQSAVPEILSSCGEAGLLEVFDWETWSITASLSDTITSLRSHSQLSIFKFVGRKVEEAIEFHQLEPLKGFPLLKILEIRVENW